MPPSGRSAKGRGTGFAALTPGATDAFHPARKTPGRAPPRPAAGVTMPFTLDTRPVRAGRAATMSSTPDTRFDTLALHAGAAPDPATGARATPIYQTTSFTFRDTDHAAALFNMERAGHVYSRISNPTVAVFEERVAALEGGAGAIGTASGQAALHLAIATLMGAGSHIVASAALYGGSQNLLHYTMRRFGIETTFVKPGDVDGWRGAIRPNTKLM